MTLFVNDATSCFDRMVPNISTLVTHKYDMKAMITRNLVVADMEHSVRTKHGDSSGTYQEESKDIKMVGKPKAQVVQAIYGASSLT